MLATLVVGAALGHWQDSQRRLGRTDPVTASVQAVLSPVTAAIDSASVEARRFVTAFGRGPETVARLERLERERSVWAGYAETVGHLERELAEARRLVGAPNFGRERVAARIVGYAPYQNRLIVGVGETEGIRPGMAVVTPEGMLGVVQTVGRDSSQALLVSSPALTFGGLARGQSNVPGLLKGHSLGRLVMDVVDVGPIRPGDAVVTSGYSETIPRGIPVGTVVEVVQDRSYSVRRVFVLPHARVGDASLVWVVK